MTMIIVWILTIITFLIGYTIGLNSSDIKEKLEEKVRPIIRKVRGQKIGAVNPLTSREFNIKGTKLEETEKAIQEDLDKIDDLL